MAKLGILSQGKLLEKSPRIQWRQAALGEFYGLIMGMAFALTASFIDLILHPNLPLAVDWRLFDMRLSVIGVGLALIGATTTLWVEFWPGLGSGLLTAGLITLGSALYTSQSSTGLKFIVLIFSLMPVAFLSLPIVLILRWLVKRHIDSLALKQAASRIIGLVLLTLVLGAISGSFLKMSQRAVSATSYMHNLLQMGNNQKILAVEGMSQRENMPYHLYQSKSKSATEGFDIRVEYEDGFAATCEVIQYPERNPRLSDCIPVP